MAFTDDQKKQLAEPLSRTRVKEREQAGRKLSYIESWWAESEANTVFGFDGWSSITAELRMVAERERKIGQAQKDGWSVSYIAKVRIEVDGVVREGWGAGHGIDVDLGLAHESAVKEAESDAEKRALKTFGNRFGLALYDKTQSNVVTGPPPPSAAVTACLNAMGACTTRAELTAWGKTNVKAIDALPTPDFNTVTAAFKAREVELTPKAVAS